MKPNRRKLPDFAPRDATAARPTPSLAHGKSVGDVNLRNPGTSSEVESTMGGQPWDYGTAGHPDFRTSSPETDGNRAPAPVHGLGPTNDDETSEEMPNGKESSGGSEIVRFLQDVKKKAFRKR